MTVRIIEEKPDPEVLKQIVCQSCGVKLEYVPIDIKEHFWGDISGRSGVEKWIECPNCIKRVFINKGK